MRPCWRQQIDAVLEDLDVNALGRCSWDGELHDEFVVFAVGVRDGVGRNLHPFCQHFGTLHLPHLLAESLP